MRPSRLFVPLFSLVAIFFVAAFSNPAFAASPDRISGALDGGQMTTLQGNVHPAARSEFDQGRTDGAKLMAGVSLVFKPSAKQQADLNKLLVQQQNPSSPNYHKWLTPAQFADRFGLSSNDVQKVVSWLQDQGFQVTKVANSRNQIFFEGTVSQIEVTFQTEIHNYLVNGILHYANATAPSVPAALGASVSELRNLHNFQPRPRAQFRRVSPDAVRPNFTSHVSGSHFLAPGDFATIYDAQSLYTANIDGSGQKIAIVGQSAINLTDIGNFRSAAGLTAKAPTILLEPSTGTSTVCTGDEGESDLDVEWSGGVARNATIIFVYVGLETGDTCTGSRTFGAFDALQYAVDQNLAPVISSSYGNCEANVTLAGAQTIQGWAQQANTQGQTIISASGDSGAADCDFQVPSATGGLAVDIPAAIPEVTGAGGTEFNGDAAATITNGNAGATTYWSGTTGGADTISSALRYIPEMGWNDSTEDIAAGGNISSSGGGKSIFFAKPTWQTGTGVPTDGKRDVPDISVSASADHDGYLFCSEDDGDSVPTCSSGFRDSNGDLALVGGTSAAAPTLAGIMALINQYLGNVPPGGLGNINPNLYAFAASAPAAFNDVPAGSNNIVPCTQGSTGCPATAPFQYGFSTNTGYDQVTGLGSVNAFTLAQAWAAIQALNTTSTALSVSATQINLGQSVTLTATVTPAAVSPGYVNFYSGTTLLGTGTLNSGGVATLATTALSGGSDSITASYVGSGSYHSSTSTATTLTVIVPSFTLAPANGATITVTPGQTGTASITMTPMNGFNAALTYSCTDPVSESTCTMSPATATTMNPVTLSVTTTAPTAKLVLPLNRGTGIFYAALLPGLLGIFLFGSGKPAGSRARLLGLIAVLGMSTLWLGSCGGTSSSSSSKNAGTPAGSYSITVNATTGGTNPVTASTTVMMTVN